MEYVQHAQLECFTTPQQKLVKIFAVLTNLSTALSVSANRTISESMEYVLNARLEQVTKHQVESVYPVIRTKFN